MADIPVTIIGGYLGAGKTTLVNSLLRQAQGERRLAILVNDFGDIAIDADLIEATDANMLQLAGGCVCCTIGNDMIDTLVTLKETMGDFDHVLVETSGVALPGVVASTIQISTGVRPDGVIVLADALNVSDQLSDKYIADTIERQLGAAQLLVLTKTDRIDESKARTVQQTLSDRFRGAQIMVSNNGDLPLNIALDLYDNPTCTDTSLKRLFSPGTNAQSDYVTGAWRSTQSIDLDQLSKLLAAPEHHVLRAKGFVTDQSGKHQIVQVVAGEVSISENTSSFDSSLLIVIGLNNKLELNSINESLLANGWTHAAE
jgi:G3E family GTPase